MTLSEFSKTRENKRKQALSTKNEKAAKPRTTGTASSTTIPTKKLVFVNVGIVTYDINTGGLKKVRGRLPVQVYDTSNVIDLKMAAIEKYGNHDQNFCPLEDYVFLYPDMSDVVLLPGTGKSFKLDQYKAELGKPYAKCVFFLCIASQYEDYKSNKLYRYCFK